MFRILQLDHIVLRISDMAAALHFYQQILGCSLEKVQPELGLYQLRAGQQLIDLVQIEQQLAAEQQNMAHFCLRIEPYQAEWLLAYFNGLAVPVSASELRFGADGYGWSCYVTDPAGNVIELKGPPQTAADL